MKIALVTTLASLVENRRIGEEIDALGHEFKLVDMSEFGFRIENGSLTVSQFNDLKKVDVVIVRGVFLAIKTISEIVKSLRKKGTKIFDNNFLEHRYSIDKVTDIVKLAINDIPVPDTLYSRDFAEYPRLAKRLDYPLVIKSSRMGKGAYVFKIENGQELADFVRSIESEGKTAKSFLLQEFIEYKYDLRILIIGKSAFTMRRIPVEGEFRANFSLGGSVEEFELDEEGKNLAVSALEAVNMTVGGVDILITEDDKRYVLEVNHTAGFVGMEKATGENIAKIYVEHAIANAK
ncbi:RimK family alpha-L-glutamate ligase [Patescibacteria group bacterium]|nr:RimK family alpha-L-glutamate ligase [Patescibacteria group bacterium]